MRVDVLCRVNRRFSYGRNPECERFGRLRAVHEKAANQSAESPQKPVETVIFFEYRLEVTNIFLTQNYVCLAPFR